MVKIKTLHRSLEDHLPTSSSSTAPVSRNLDPSLHPFSRSREYTRAVTAAKLERMFAKPFVGALEGHGDGLYSMTKDEAGALPRIASGSGDGEVRVWDLASRESVWDATGAHRGMVKGLAFSHPAQGEEGRIERAQGEKNKKRKRPKLGDKRGKRPMREAGEDSDYESEDDDDEIVRSVSRGSPRLLTCGVDKTVKLWDVTGQKGNDVKPLQTYVGKSGFNSISHHRYDPVFATASHSIDIWDETKTAPLSTLKFHSTSNLSTGEHIVCVAFNKSETSVLASSGSDRTVCLYDLRSGKAVGRVSMTMRVNQLVFNPLQPPVLLCASEDHHLYTFDMRNLSTTTQMYKGHVGAVMSCDWAPTGREFVSGSYDRTLRLWTSGEGKARDTYHTKRMQRVFTSLYTLDNRFVLSGSDDSNLRIWKARASDKLGVIDKREQARKEYRDGLRDKWASVGDVAKLERQRFMPKSIHNAETLRRTMLEARVRKDENKRKHAPKGIDADKLKPKPAKRGVIERVES
ncbi:BQ2448_4606 [Microbotryum intermedium]|uniref:DDB1- and CUL4-associated factor 13 n=1 Tax=Microbotryum intermedium TaxID=269621 RepID=A0A238FDL1_9BASI|nr:BQ2448_4606 [Microbotryum intermedium]